MQAIPDVQFDVILARPREPGKPRTVLSRHYGNSRMGLVIPVNGPDEEIVGPYEIIIHPFVEETDGPR